MCHGHEWEILKQSYEREIARRNREKADEAAKAPASTPVSPATAPSRNEEPVPV